MESKPRVERAGKGAGERGERERAGARRGGLIHGGGEHGGMATVVVRWRRRQRARQVGAVATGEEDDTALADNPQASLSFLQL